MKKYLLLSIFSLLHIACQQEVSDRDYVVFSGKIENITLDSIIVFHPKVEYRKAIAVNTDGVFNDTLKVKNGMFSYRDGKNYTSIYLKNNDSLLMNYDANNFHKSLLFKGNHANENVFLSKYVKAENDLLIDTKLMRSEKEVFDNSINKFVDDLQKDLNKIDVDPIFKEFQLKEINSFKNYIVSSYTKTNYNKLFLAKGKPSPEFTNFENFIGGTTSLSDLKGKYIYIDVWATYCKPCENEVPFLRKIEEKYHNKNITFVSISVDSEKDYELWKKTVAEKSMTGIQLYAKDDTKFTNDYRIITIPRFILIDPKGKIVDANAPKPSNTALVDLLNSLDI